MADQRIFKGVVGGAWRDAQRLGCHLLVEPVQRLDLEHEVGTGRQRVAQLAVNVEQAWSGTHGAQSRAPSAHPGRGRSGDGRPRQRRRVSSADASPCRTAALAGPPARRRTILSIRCCNSASRSSLRPTCTGDTWMLVLRGATSQSKRSRSDSRPIGPAASPPAHTSRNRLQRARIDSRSGRGVEREHARLVELDQCLQEALVRAGDDHAGVDELAAVDVRHHPHDRVVIRAAQRGHGWPPRRSGAAAAAVPSGSAR